MEFFPLLSSKKKNFSLSLLCHNILDVQLYFLPDVVKSGQKKFWSVDRHRGSVHVFLTNDKAKSL